MSSHHIIREDQEPALLIMDAYAIPLAQVQQLLEWSPTVIVSEHALTEVMSWGIKIDMAIATNKNIPSWTVSLRDQLPIKIISCNSEKEILTSALCFLQASKQKAVNIVSTEMLEVFESFKALDLSVLQSNKRWSFIRNGVFEKWLPANSIVTIRQGKVVEEIKTEREKLITIHKSSSFWIGESL